MGAHQGAQGAGRGEKAEAEELGAGRGTVVPTHVHALSHGIYGRGLGGGSRFPSFFLSFCSDSFSFVISLVRAISSWDRPGRRVKGSLQRAASRGQRTGNPVKKCAAIGYLGRLYIE